MDQWELSVYDKRFKDDRVRTSDDVIFLRSMQWHETVQHSLIKYPYSVASWVYIEQLLSLVKKIWLLVKP